MPDGLHYLCFPHSSNRVCGKDDHPILFDGGWDDDNIRQEVSHWVQRLNTTKLELVPVDEYHRKWDLSMKMGRAAGTLFNFAAWFDKRQEMYSLDDDTKMKDVVKEYLEVLHGEGAPA